jgi:hypothetical protein
MKALGTIVATVGILAGGFSALATPITFDNVASTYWTTGTTYDGQKGHGNDLGGSISGITFGAGDQVTTGSGLLPVHSGNFGLTDSGLFNPVISFTYASAQTDVSFWYSSVFGFTADAYSASGKLLDVVYEGANIGLDSFLDFDITGIDKVVIRDDSGYGGFVTVDDVSMNSQGTTVPDSTSTLGLLGLAMLGLLAFRRKVVVA